MFSHGFFFQFIFIEINLEYFFIPTILLKDIGIKCKDGRYWELSGRIQFNLRYIWMIHNFSREYETVILVYFQRGWTRG